MNHKKFLSKIPLPEEVKEGIRTRSEVLSSMSNNLELEDLIQEGLVLVYGIKQSNPDASLEYIMKAINYHYADIQDEAVNNKARMVSLNSEHMERELDNRAYRHYQKNPAESKKKISSVPSLLQGGTGGQLEPIILLREEGYTFKEIAKLLNKDVKTIRKILRSAGKEDE